MLEINRNIVGNISGSGNTIFQLNLNGKDVQVTLDELVRKNPNFSKNTEEIESLQKQIQYLTKLDGYNTREIKQLNIQIENLQRERTLLMKQTSATAVSKNIESDKSIEIKIEEYLFVGDIESARAFITESLDGPNSLNDIDRCTLLLNLARINSYKDEFEGVDALVAEAISINNSWNTNYLAGEIYSIQGDISKSERYFSISLDFANANLEEVYSLNALAICSSELNNLRNAERFAQDSIDALARIDAEDIFNYVSLELFRISVLWKLSDHEEAISCQEQLVLKVTKKFNANMLENCVTFMQVMSSYSEYLLNLGRKKEALLMAKGAFKGCEIADYFCVNVDTTTKFNVFLCLSHAEAEDKDFNSAIHSSRRLVEIVEADKLVDNYQKLSAYSTHGNNLVETGKLSEGIDFLRMSLSIFDIIIEGNSLSFLEEKLRVIKNLAAAYQEYDIVESNELIINAITLIIREERFCSLKFMINFKCAFYIMLSMNYYDLNKFEKSKEYLALCKDILVNVDDSAPKEIIKFGIIHLTSLLYEN